MPYPTLFAHLRREESKECELGDKATDPSIKAVHFDLAGHYAGHGDEIRRICAEKGILVPNSSNT